jgi:integrase
VAVAKAKAIIDAHTRGQVEAIRSAHVRPSGSGFCTFAEVFAVVDQLPIEANAATRASYVWGLRWVLRWALGLAGQDAPIDHLSTKLLNDDTARTFFERITTHASKIDDQGEANRFKRNAQTFFDNSRALFAPKALRAMRKTFGLQLPDLSDWRAARKHHAPHVPDSSEFLAPPDAVWRRTLREWVRLAQTPNYSVPGCEKRAHGAPLSDLDRRNMFIAVGLMLACGLRKSEVTKCRWNWFQTEDSAPVLRADRVDVKNKSGRLEVSPVDPFWKILNFWVMRNTWRGADDAFCLEIRPQTAGAHRYLHFKDGGDSDRKYWPFWLVGKWLRHLGWTTQKTNHALRDFTASKLTTRYGLDAACEWCRHSQLATTQKHYNRFKSRGERVNPKRLAWLRWAR